MITRIMIATVATSFMIATGFSQMKYSRTKPSPTPTPTPTPQQKTPGVKAQQPMSQRTMSPPTQLRPAPPRTAAGPSPQQKMAPTQAQSPAPPQIQMQTATQSKATSMAAQTQPKQMAPTRTVAAAIQPKAMPTPAPTPVKPTPTPVPPPDAKAYLDHQVANSKDKKFHMTVNGKDLALAPFHVWAQKSTGPNSTSTCIDMKSDDGNIYDIDFVTTGAQVTGIRIHRINGEALR